MLTGYKCVARFFRWWGGELADYLPSFVRVAFGRGRKCLTVEISEQGAVFEFARDHSVEPLGRVEFEGKSEAETKRAVANLVGLRAHEIRDIVVQLPRDKVLRRIVDLPLAAAENISEVLSFWMDRHTPFKADEVYYDFRVVDADPEEKRLQVDLVVAQRKIADEAVRMATAWGIEPTRVDAASDDADRVQSFRSLSSASRPRASLSNVLSGVLAMTACALLAAAVYLPLERKTSHLAALEARLAVVRAEALAADELRNIVEQTLARSRFVIDRRQATPTMSELLAEVTQRVPDNTWLQQMRILGLRLDLQGYSANPTALIGLFEESETFSQVRFPAPVTMDPRIGLERFGLSASMAEEGE
jgi:general secretion pathway protein L